MQWIKKGNKISVAILTGKRALGDLGFVQKMTLQCDERSRVSSCGLGSPGTSCVRLGRRQGNVWLCKGRGIYRPAEGLYIFKEAFCSLELFIANKFHVRLFSFI
jgi:hypothetical protein